MDVDHLLMGICMPTFSEVHPKLQHKSFFDHFSSPLEVKTMQCSRTDTGPSELCCCASQCMASLVQHKLDSIISFEKEHQDVTSHGEGSWGGGRKTGLMKAQGSEEINFVTAWPCLPASGTEARSRRWQLQGPCGCVTAHKCCCHQQTAYIQLQTTNVCNKCRQHCMQELIRCNREKKEIRWNLKLCTAGTTSYTSVIHHQQDLTMIPPEKTGNF